MREFAVPPTVTVADEDNLSDVVFANAERFGHSVLYRRKVDGTWVDVSARDFAAQVLAVAKGLIAAGLAAGDRVGLLSRTSYEWTLLDFAILAAGGVTVPIYETSAPGQIEWILSDSGARAVIVESAAHRAGLNSVVDHLPELAHVWQLDDGGADTAGAIDELTALGADREDAEVHARRRAVRADDTATLVYTSGTTGPPKGCQLTNRNLLAEVRTIVGLIPELFNANGSVLLFLPLAHVFARVVQFGGAHARVTIGHTADVRTLLADLAEFRPTLVLSVPRVFEKVYNGARHKAHAAGGANGRVFDAADETAVAWSRANQSGGPDLLLRARHALFDRLVYGRLRAALGGRCAAAVSAGAPLGERLGHFFTGAGIPVYEAYGMTEVSGAATLNTPHHQRIGTVGRPMPGAGIRIDDDGEVLISGAIVSRGYWNDDAATGELRTGDGWLRSGDLGTLDADGNLRITGRKKELIVTAGGKNVAPATLEDRLRAHPLISHCMVVGDNRPFIGALITLDAEALGGWLELRGQAGELPDPTDPAAMAMLAADPDLMAEVQAAVEQANRAVSRAEAIRQFRILATDFTEAGGELTPTLKLKRRVIAEQHADDIESIYASGP